MELFIIATIVIATLHFVYDGILLPSIRFNLRNKLFDLRDQLRELRINNEIDDESFNLLHSSLNNFIGNIHKLTFAVSVSARTAYRTDAKLREKVRNRVSFLSSHDNEGIRRIFHELNTVVEKAFISNFGAWFLYVIPIAMVFSSIKKLSDIANNLIVMPTNRVNDLIPQA